jgi:hypothetical protein
VEDIFLSELVKGFLKPGEYRPKNAPKANGSGKDDNDDTVASDTEASSSNEAAAQPAVCCNSHSLMHS